MTYFRSEQKRSRLRPEILAAFCFNRSGRIQEKALYIADIQGFLLSFGVSFWPPLERKTGLALALRASVFPRTAVDTPGPWKGRIEVAGDGSASQNTKQQGEPLRFSLLLWSGKRDSDPRPQPWQGCALPTELFPHMTPKFAARECKYIPKFRFCKILRPFCRKTAPFTHPSKKDPRPCTDRGSLSKSASPQRISAP